MSNIIKSKYAIGADLMGHVYSVAVTLDGLKKRGRKIERQYISIGYISLDHDQASLIEHCRCAINTEMKSVSSPTFTVLLNNAELLDNGVIRMRLLDPRRKKIEVAL